MSLGRFLCLPEPLRAGAGSVLHSMVVYLGAFPFPSLAPSILTREAMLKVITILTGRYKKILKRGNRDKTKLLFRSLAVFDRRASTFTSPSEKPSMKDIINEQKPDDMLEQEAVLKEGRSHAAGFAVDEPVNDGEEEDEDDLALAALDSLDAIEVFKQDQKVDRKINHAIIPTENLKKLVMLLLLLGGLEAQSPLPAYSEGLDDVVVKSLELSAAAIIAAFDPDRVNGGIRYSNFVKVVTLSLPDLFEPLSALFEHFLFSKTLDLGKHKGEVPAPTATIPKASPIYRTPSESASIFTETILSQLSISLHISIPANSLSNIYTSCARFNQIFSTASQGTSLSSLSRQITSWQSATLLLISGITSNSSPVLFGAYLPSSWRDSTNSYTTPPAPDPSTPKGSMFQLLPRHSIFPANPYNRETPLSYFSQKTGIALGCVVPAQSRSAAAPQPPIPGPVSLLIDEDISTATFQHDPDAGGGAFNIDPALTAAQIHHPETAQRKKVEFDIDTLEIWGISFPEPSSKDDELTKQKNRLKWEEDEAARRRGVNFGGDKDGARALLEMAGLVGDKAGQGRSGGSV